MISLKQITDDLKSDLEKTKKELDIALARLRDQDDSLKGTQYDNHSLKQKLRSLEYINSKN